MQIARILFPVYVLGPGERVGIWTIGCKRGCNECANPELWKSDASRNLSMDAIRQLLDKIAQKHRIDGITISGGEPFLQTKELLLLVDACLAYTDDILIFTGYRRETLQKRVRLGSETREILEKIAVLVDGKYIADKNQGHPLKGSENQRIFYRNEQIRERYETYIQEKMGTQQVQNFHSTEGVVSLGIHERSFYEQFQRR